jgi:hypothetical protein
MVKVWRRLVASLPGSDRSARVRLRRMACPCCRQHVWVIVGPPEVADCLESVRCSHRLAPGNPETLNSRSFPSRATWALFVR